MCTILCIVLLFRRVHPSACPVRLVCRISLCRSADRLACPSACPIQWVFCISLCRSSDRHARPSACPVRLVCRISLRRSADWRPHHFRVLAADLCLFSFSRDFDTGPAFAAAAIAPALVIAMIQTLNASCCRERMPKIFCNDDTMV